MKICRTFSRKHHRFLFSIHLILSLRFSPPFSFVTISNDRTESPFFKLTFSEKLPWSLSGSHYRSYLKHYLHHFLHWSSRYWRWIQLDDKLRFSSSCSEYWVLLKSCSRLTLKYAFEFYSFSSLKHSLRFKFWSCFAV